MLTGERSCSAVALPLSTPLPSLRDALARRAAIFGPVDADAVPMAPLGFWQALGAMARNIVEALTPGFAS